MIQLVCPDCKRKMNTVKTKLLIEATGFMRIVFGREAGIERAVSSPLHTREIPSRGKVIPDDNYICSECGKESPAKLWKYVITCESCGRALNKNPIESPSATVDENICRDTMSVYCDRCWSQFNKEYCSECRYCETCLSYNNR